MKWLARFFRAALDQEDLAVSAESFLRAGGSVSLSDWARLEIAEKKALLEAGERVRTTTIVKLAIALRGPAGVAEVLAPFDGGLLRQHQAALDELERAAGEVT